MSFLNPMPEEAVQWPGQPGISQDTAIKAQTDSIITWFAQQRADASAKGLWNDKTGLPTQKGLLNGLGQYGDALVAGTSAPGRPGIKAFHGSPHDFEKFDNAKIGTGEGVQAYGHGMYFAENEGVAQGYRDKLSSIQLRANGAPFDASNPVHDAAMLARSYPTPEAAASSLRQQANTWAKVKGDQAQATSARYKQAADLIEQGNLPTIENPQGHMYEVGINANPDHFLDWDKPLSEQSPHVRKALAKAGVPTVGRWQQHDDGTLGYYSAQGQQGTVRPYDRGMGDGPEFLASYDTLNNGRGSQRFKTQQEAQQFLEQSAPIEAGRGADIYQTMRKQNSSDAAISQALHEAGIHGISYLDAGSRGAGEGSRNHVVFNPEKIEILRKYGIAGLMAAGAAAAKSSDQ